MDSRSLQETPTWAVSVICAGLVLVSMIIERGLHLLTKFFLRRKRKAVNKSLEKIKQELMLLGFISLLLSVTKRPIASVCVPKRVVDSFNPCSSLDFHNSHTNQQNGGDSDDDEARKNLSSCQKKGMESFISSSGIKQLHMFIFILAVFHVFHCLLIVAFGRAKMRRWKRWEDETRSPEYQLTYDTRRFRLTRQTSFGRRHLKFWSDHPIFLWPVCFLRQFAKPVSKADYFALRHGFITAHIGSGVASYNFQEFLIRALDEDFEMVVGVRFWIWTVSLLLVFFNARVFYSYFWLPFIPLVMLLVLGTKLQEVITRMCIESEREASVVGGRLVVKPNDKLFWFARPYLMLHLIHFILFQNSFQLAFFTWTLYEFGTSSCFHDKAQGIAIKVATGVCVLLLCGYVILPQYALVNQMGSKMRKAVLTEFISRGLRNWHSIAFKKLKNAQHSESHSSKHSPANRFVLSPDSFKQNTDSVTVDRLELSFNAIHGAAINAAPSSEITEEDLPHFLRSKEGGGL